MNHKKEEYEINIVQLPNKILREKSQDVALPLSDEDILLAKKMIYHVEDSIKPKSKFRSFVNQFIAEDLNNVKDYVVKDVIIPQIKKGLCDSIQNAANLIFYGDAGKGRNNNSLPVSRVSYGSYYSGNSSISSNAKPQRASTINGLDYEDVIIFNPPNSPASSAKGEAELVIDQMTELISKYHIAAISDLYDFCGINTDNYCLQDYGWNINNWYNPKAIYVRLSDGRDGWQLKLPKPVALDK